MPDINVNKLSEVLNTKADIDLNNTGVFSTSEGGGVNLTSSTPANASGKEVTSADFIKSNLLNYTTNGILEIPQDIKLELNNGTLTLKAGSKVYVPNGPGVFDAVTISTDRSLTNTSNDTYMVFAKSNGSGIELARLENQTGSGTTTPTSSWWAYYNTSDNKVYRIENGVNVRQLALPLAIVTVSSGAISSIDQVFNGFGYIGSTVFALPGVKGLIPNGRNADGSLKNIEFVINKVTTSQMASTFNNGSLVYLYNGGLGLNYYKYDNKNNCLIHPKTGEVYDRLEVASVSNVSGRITSFTPKTAFHAVDYNDSSWLSGLGMPSNKYIDLTLGASGSTYTAPANGWFHLQKLSGVANAIINLYNQRVGHSSFGISISSGNYASMNLNAYLPVKKGDSIYISYNATGETKYFTFNYAEGDQ